MKLQSTLLAAIAVLATANAWLSSNNLSTKRMDTAVGMGSKVSIQWEKKKAWLGKRGYGMTGGTKVPAAEIIGAGRIGGLLAEAGECVVIGREDSIDADGKGPILITTRNDALDGIIEKCPENRRKDLVFMQNGYLDKFLEYKGLLDNTQVLLYLAVTAKGVPAIDGVTTVNPEGLTTATGEHAQAFSDRLASMNLKCKVVSAGDYRLAMFEKLIWISTYMLVGTAKECKSVGQAGSDHADLVEEVVNELVAAVSVKEGITFPAGTMERLAAYTDVVTSFPCAVKEWEWRNEYFFNLGDEACPTHNSLLKECAEKGFLGFELPESKAGESVAEESAMEESGAQE